MKLPQFSLKKMHLKMSSAKRPLLFRLGLSESTKKNHQASGSKRMSIQQTCVWFKANVTSLIIKNVLHMLRIVGPTVTTG